MAIFNTVYGGEPKWRPWANTMIYYKFDWNLNDSSWNNRNWTAWWTITYWTNYVDLTNWYIILPNSPTTYENERTFCMWFKINKSSGAWFLLDISSSNGMIIRLEVNSSNNFNCHSDMPSYQPQELSSRDTNRHLYTVTFNSSNINYYLDGTLKWSKNPRNSSYTFLSWRIWTVHNGSYVNWLQQYVWVYILENKARTAQEISEYYNQTKWNYWL